MSFLVAFQTQMTIINTEFTVCQTLSMFGIFVSAFYISLTSVILLTATLEQKYDTY